MRPVLSQWVFALCMASLAMPVVAQGTGSARRSKVDITRIGSNVQCVMDALKSGDLGEKARCSGNGLAQWHGELLELQLHIAAPHHPRTIPAELFTRLGGRGGVRGIDTMLAWLPPARVPELVAREPRIVFVQMPQRPVTWTGKVAGQGGPLLVSDEVKCTGMTGKGVTVAVVDSGFSNLDKSKKNGEVPKIVGKVAYIGGSHGTMCAEVVAEVAPGASIYPVATPSLPIMQAFIEEVTGPNKYGVDIISHSVGWLGVSFGRHTGPLCKLTDMARAAGIAWVNASGNNGGGNFYRGVYRDTDFDGNHDVLPNEPKLLFKLGDNADVQIYFDWDDYEAHQLDLDLHLFREEKGFFQLYSKSTKITGFFTGTSEIIAIKGVPSGVYALVMRRGKGSPDPTGVQLRILNKSTKSTPLSIHHKNNNVYDPASCKGVLAVGAMRHGWWQKGPLEDYSSYGPMVDGRQKPELVGPTGVSTSVGAFYGTSAACPHVAGALALYAQATQGTALDMVDALIDDADPFGPEDPDVAHGYGRVRLSAARLGWECDAENPDLPVACTSTCGTVGKRWCGATCGWHKCVPPWETCNGIDDDCDGLTDELPECGGDEVDAGGSGEDSGVLGDVVAAGDALSDAGIPTSKPPGDDGGDGCQTRRVSIDRSGPWQMLFLGLGCLIVGSARRRERT